MLRIIQIVENMKIRKISNKNIQHGLRNWWLMGFKREGPRFNPCSDRNLFLAKLNQKL